ncbi:MAG: glycosyltransferase [Chloroflexota bacterium]
MTADDTRPVTSTPESGSSLSAPVRILHVVPKLSVGGGVATQLLSVIKRYDRSRIIPYVCSLRESSAVGRELERLGVTVVSLNRDFKRGFDWTAVRDLYLLMKQHRFSIVRTHEYRANLHGRCAALLATVPCIVASVHTMYLSEHHDYDRETKLNRRITNKLLGSLTDRVVAVSETVREQVIHYDGLAKDKVTVIYNGIETDRFIHASGEQVRKEFGITRGAPVVGYLGRLNETKGTDDLVKAFAKITPMFPDAVLLIVGDGPLRDDLESAARVLGISDRVIFAGLRLDKENILAAMDIFAFPSLTEGHPNALVEAMAAGKPIVATDIPPVREILDGRGDALLVPVKNPDEIAMSLEVLLRDREISETLGQTAQRKALSRFGIDNTVSRHLALYADILKKKGVRSAL